MKKFFAIFLIFALVGSLAACSNTPSDSSKTSDMSTSSADLPSSGRDEISEVEDESKGTTQTDGSNILIAYFTMPEDVDTTGVDAVAGASVVVNNDEVMGNVEYMASIIQNTVGGDLFQIETVQQYPLDHDTLVDQAAEEQDTGARPELSTHIENLDQYDIIFLGYPKMQYGFLSV